MLSQHANSGQSIWETAAKDDETFKLQIMASLIQSFTIREGVQKTPFFGRSLPNVGGWVGWFPNKVQTTQNLAKSPRKLPFSTRISPFVQKNVFSFRRLPLEKTYSEKFWFQTGWTFSVGSCLLLCDWTRPAVPQNILVCPTAGDSSELLYLWNWR